MRRIFLLAVCTMLFGSGCAHPGSSGTISAPHSTTTSTVTTDPAIFTAVLRRYLTTPGENSFPGRAFPVVYVLDRTDAAAADHIEPAGPSGGRVISAGDQRRIVDALSDVSNVRFIVDRSDVVDRVRGCEQVRNGGILIQLGPPDGGSDRVEVAVFGFVACLGATWVTYVVVRDGSAWTVTGTTGPVAVA
jgi:hypothetical protein